MKQSIDQARYQLSFKQMFVVITLLCVLFANHAAVLQREANRRSKCLPALRQDHPYWSTPVGQRILEASNRWSEMSDAERVRINKARRLREVGPLSVRLVVSFTVVAWLVVRLVASLKQQWQTSRAR